MRPADVIGAAIKAANSALDLTDQVGSKRWETSGVGPTLPVPDFVRLGRYQIL